MTDQSSNAAKPINGMEVEQEGKSVVPHEQTENSLVIGDAPALPAVAKKSAKGDLDRRWRRKNDITTSHGLAREHARLIAAMHNGRVTLDAGDILSRAYGRQRELVATNEVKQSLADLAQQLADLRNERSVVSDVFPRDSS